MNDSILRGQGVVLRFGELFLKGKNRYLFEEALERNVRIAVSDRSDLKVTRRHGRIFVLGASDYDVLEKLDKVFGVASLSPAFFCERDLDAITKAAVDMAADSSTGAGSFRIAARRADKSYPLTSMELGRHIGAAVCQATSLPVDLDNADLAIGVEIGNDWVFVWTEQRSGAKGLPVGTAGKAVLLLSGGIDSPVAGYMMQKRGLELCAVFFHSFPYTGHMAKGKAIDLAKVLARRQGRLRLYAVPFARVQELLRDNAPAPYLVILYRRAMLRISERLAQREGAKALVTGESLGQVASQTLPNIAAIEEAASMPILRPLIGFDKEETIALSKRIASYEISIIPHDDCCSLFIPKHPETKGNGETARRIEDQLDWKIAIDEAVAQAEAIDL